MAEQQDNHVLEAEVKNTVFSAENSGFAVIRVNTPEGKLETAVGKLAGVQPGEFLRMRGDWIQNERFGKQFSVKSYTIQTPRTLLGLTRYLSSGILPGVGPKTAERIVETFGEDTLDILSADPERLREVKGVGRSRIETIIDSWGERTYLNEIVAFLQSYGISPVYANRIYRRYKEGAVSVLKQNPYQLAWEIHGIGFKKADEIALEMGMEPDGPIRCGAAVIYLLRQFSEQGHSFYPLDGVLQAAMQLIETDEEAIGRGIKEALKEERIVLKDLEWVDDASGQRWQGQGLYLSKLFHTEVQSAKHIARVRSSIQQSEIDLDALGPFLRQFGDKTGMHLGDQQTQAIKKAATSAITVITGGPGTGKTTLIRFLIAFLTSQKKSVALAAPTGRAAKRLQEATGESAKTLHRLLEFNPREDPPFVRCEDNPINAHWIIVDETSMVDLFMIKHLLDAVENGSHIVFVGDVDQLPSVGCGNVLGDLMDSKRVDVVRLTEIYRQAQGSLITQNAHRINEGRFPTLIALDPNKRKPQEDPEATYLREEDIDFFFIQEESPKKVADKITQLCAVELPRKFHVNAFEDIQVITPMHRGELGSRNLNQILQEALNGKKGLELKSKKSERIFRLGDRVMQIRNNYDKDVFNGDIGQIQSVDADKEEILVQFDFTQAAYSLNELDELELAYAVTVHKSQGSEYPIIVMPLATQHFMMLQRNLLYTAVTRGKMKVVVVGSTKALAMAIQNDRTTKRFSYLANRIRIACAKKKDFSQETDEAEVVKTP